MLYKIAFTIGIIIAVWKGFKLFETFKHKLADDDEDRPARPKTTSKRTASNNDATGARTKSKTLDLVECPKCGAYVPNGTICKSVAECTHRQS